MSAEPTETRQCGRCRLWFPIDAGTHPMELTAWWACPSCVTALMPDRRRPTAATTATTSPGYPT